MLDEIFSENNIIPLPTSKHKDKQVQLQINIRIKNGFLLWASTYSTHAYLKYKDLSPNYL